MTLVHSVGWAATLTEVVKGALSNDPWVKEGRGDVDCIAASINSNSAIGLHVAARQS